MAEPVSKVRLLAQGFAQRLEVVQPSVEDWRRGRNAATAPRADVVAPFRPRASLLAGPGPRLSLSLPTERADPSSPLEREPGGYSLTYLKNADISSLAISGNVLMGNDLSFPFPAVGSEAELGDGSGVVEREHVRFVFERVRLPDGTELHKATGRMTLIERDGEIVGMLRGSVELDPGAATVLRADRGPVVLPGHRGALGELRYGGAIVRDDAVVGLAAATDATLDGVRVVTREVPTSFSFTAPETYTLGASATIAGVPSDRRIIARGEGFDVLVEGRRIRVLEGGVVFENGRYMEPLEGAKVRVLADHDDPGPRRDHGALLERGGLVKWAAPAQAELFRGGVSWRDVSMGAVGDCFLMAAVISIARHRPELIKGLVTDRGNGSYAVRFFGRDGVAREHLVDADAYHLTEPVVHPTYARSADPLELWGPLVEKAYTRFAGIDYHKLDEGGISEEALQALTGVKPESWSFWLNTRETLFEVAREAVRKGEPVVTSTGTLLELRTAELAELGLVDRHAYVLLDAYEEAGRKWVVLHNPWGNFELRGRSYGADVDVDRNGMPDGNDGTFRMSLEDWAANFSRIVVAHLPQPSPTPAAAVVPSAPAASATLPAL